MSRACYKLLIHFATLNSTKLIPTNDFEFIYLFSLQIKGSVKSYSVLNLEEMCQSQGVERETQYRPGEVKDETYISRMEVCTLAQCKNKHVMFTLNVLLNFLTLKNNNSKFKIILLDKIMVCGLTLITLFLLCAHNGYSLLL